MLESRAPAENTFRRERRRERGPDRSGIDLGRRGRGTARRHVAHRRTRRRARAQRTRDRTARVDRAAVAHRARASALAGQRGERRAAAQPGGTARPAVPHRRGDRVGDPGRCARAADPVVGQVLPGEPGGCAADAGVAATGEHRRRPFARAARPVDRTAQCHARAGPAGPGVVAGAHARHPGFRCADGHLRDDGDQRRVRFPARRRPAHGAGRAAAPGPARRSHGGPLRR